jgi:hypothetical protein
MRHTLGDWRIGQNDGQALNARQFPNLGGRANGKVIAPAQRDEKTLSASVNSSLVVDYGFGASLTGDIPVMRG